MIPSLSYKFYCSKQYLEWKKCVEKAKKAGYNEKMCSKKCHHIYSSFFLLNGNPDNVFNHIEKGVKFPYDPSQFGELPKNKL